MLNYSKQDIIQHLSNNRTVVLFTTKETILLNIKHTSLSIIDEILNRPDKERLVESIKTYINFDMKSDLQWHDVSPANTERAKRVLKDSENIAKIAIDQLLTNHRYNS